MELIYRYLGMTLFWFSLSFGITYIVSGILFYVLDKMTDQNKVIEAYYAYLKQKIEKEGR